MVASRTIALTSCAALAALALSGCITLQAIEPVIEPPHVFMGDVTVPVEFAAPGTIGFRCAERGATFLGLPGINAGACADRNLVTMIDPCLTLTAGDYASAMCKGLDQRREEASLAPVAPASRPGAKTPQLIRASLADTGSASAGAPALRGRSDGHADMPASTLPLALVEFVSASKIAFACAERGAKMVSAEGGLEACADRLMVTMVNPCDPTVSGWYARTLCHELAHVNGWPADHPVGEHVRGPFRLASESPQAIALAAARRAETRPVETDAHAAEALTAESLTAPDQALLAENLAGLVRALGLDRLPQTMRSVWSSLRGSLAAYASEPADAPTHALPHAQPHATHLHADRHGARSDFHAR